MRFVTGIMMLRNQESEDGRQQHENQRLHKTDQHLEEVERNRDNPGKELSAAVRHRFQHDLTGVNVTEKSEAERDRAEENRHNLEPANNEENEDHQDLQK